MAPATALLDLDTGPWAIAPAILESLIVRSRDITIDAEVMQKASERRSAYKRIDGHAVIDIDGVMVKNPHFLSSILRITATSMVRTAVLAASVDDSIDTIILRIDSPGGSTRGVGDLADAVYGARKRKRIVACIQDMAASAAYEVASQAHTVIANPSALVGGIGVYSVIEDWSAFFEARGVKVHVVRFGEFKGLAADGTIVTDSQLAEVGRVVDAFGQMFVSAVSRGRGLSIDRARALADGRVHIAADALRLGLVDRIETWEETIGVSAATSLVRAESTPDTNKMSARTAPFPGYSKYNERRYGTSFPTVGNVADWCNRMVADEMRKGKSQFDAEWDVRRWYSAEWAAREQVKNQE